jgi:HAD superfamily hydrolase (TIGR01450 family)
VSAMTDVSSLVEPVSQLLLDLDGTVYIDGTVIDGVRESLAMWVESGRSVVFITNNTSRTKAEHAERLSGLGLPATIENVVTPVESTAEWLRGSGFTRAFFLAPSSVVGEFAEHRIEQDDIAPDVVVVAFDKELTFAKLDRASRLVNSGTPYVATHPDFFCPTEDGPVPDCGSFTAMIRDVTGVSPLAVFGKPSKSLAELIQKEYSKGSILVGDRLHTDILTGANAGIPTCLVLTGESTRDDIENSAAEPTVVSPSLPELVAALLQLG